jgi:hypothetical protein
MQRRLRHGVRNCRAGGAVFHPGSHRDYRGDRSLLFHLLPTTS